MLVTALQAAAVTNVSSLMTLSSSGLGVREIISVDEEVVVVVVVR
jgi:hypothetical protein